MRHMSSGIGCSRTSRGYYHDGFLPHSIKVIYKLHVETDGEWWHIVPLTWESVEEVVNKKLNIRYSPARYHLLASSPTTNTAICHLPVPQTRSSNATKTILQIQTMAERQIHQKYLFLVIFPLNEEDVAQKPSSWTKATVVKNTRKGWWWYCCQGANWATGERSEREWSPRERKEE